MKYSTAKLRQPHIVDYIDYHDKSQYLYIVMEYVPGGDLAVYLNTVGMMPERSGQLVASQVSSALSYLHALGIVHRDIKPDNLLISHQDPIQVKLSDFGLSKVIKDEETFLKTFCGTLLYCAPEVYPEFGRYPRRGVPKQRRRATDPYVTQASTIFKSGLTCSSRPSKTLPYSAAVDVWSLGAVLFHLLSTKPPYNCSGDDKGASMLENIMMKELNYTPLQLAGVSEDGINFIRAMINPTPSERVTIDELFSFPWINKVLEESNLSQISDFKPSQESFLAHRGGRLDEIDEDSEEDEYPELSELEHQFGANGQPSDWSPAKTYAAGPANNRTEQNRLFGEIDPGAIRSSGVLSHDARAALQIDRKSDWDDWSFDFDNMQSFRQSKHLSQQSLSMPPMQREHSSPSLFGAEAQIGRLNMVSGETIASDKSYPTAPATPKTPGSPDHSFAASFSVTGSKRSPAFSASDEATPKRVKVEEGAADRRTSLPAVDVLRDVKAEGPTRSPTVNSRFINAYQNLDVAGSDSTGSEQSLKVPTRTEKRTSKLKKKRKDIEATSINSPLLPPDIRSTEVQGHAKGSQSPASLQGLPWSTAPAYPTLRRQSGNLVDHQSLASSSNASSARFNDENEDPVKYPSLQLPNSASRHSTFSSTGGSNESSQENPRKDSFTVRNPHQARTQALPPANFLSSSVHAPADPVLGHLRTTPDSCIRLNIDMTGRITMWGRELYNTHVWPDDNDRRIPRAAFDIVFWCKAFGNAIEISPELFWQETDNVRASIRTRSSMGIFINDEKLERCDEHADHFGFLCSGDVVTVNAKAGETIRFVCDFKIGESRAPRAAGKTFEVQTMKVGKAK